jgi:hypothetical protein
MEQTNYFFIALSNYLSSLKFREAAELAKLLGYSDPKCEKFRESMFNSVIQTAKKVINPFPAPKNFFFSFASPMHALP